jgi:hypothetical protein
MDDDLKILEREIKTLEKISGFPREIGYLAQEAMRFYTVAASLRGTFALDNSSIEERQITHILTRSLLEGYFWLLYIFDDPAKRSGRYDEKLNSFKREYAKLWDEPQLTYRDQLEPAGPGWAKLPKPMDLNSMLAQLKNAYGNRLNYLYYVYRVSSFDTHGNSLRVIFEEVFGKKCNFIALDLNFGFDLMANQYLGILQDLRSAGEI